MNCCFQDLLQSSWNQIDLLQTQRQSAARSSEEFRSAPEAPGFLLLLCSSSLSKQIVAVRGLPPGCGFLSNTADSPLTPHLFVHRGPPWACWTSSPPSRPDPTSSSMRRTWWQIFWGRWRRRRGSRRRSLPWVRWLLRGVWSARFWWLHIKKVLDGSAAVPFRCTTLVLDCCTWWKVDLVNPPTNRRCFRKVYLQAAEYFLLGLMNLEQLLSEHLFRLIHCCHP